MTRHCKCATIETLAADALDVRELKRRALIADRRVEVGPSLRWPKIQAMTINRYGIQLKLWGRRDSQRIRISWTMVHLGGQRPWVHCPFCQSRVARLYRGLAGYSCRKCIGNPPYASQMLSPGARLQFQALKIRLQLGGVADLASPFPDRPRYANRRAYRRIKARAQSLEWGLSRRIKARKADYRSLCAYVP